MQLLFSEPRRTLSSPPRARRRHDSAPDKLPEVPEKCLGRQRCPAGRLRVPRGGRAWFGPLSVWAAGRSGRGVGRRVRCEAIRERRRGQGQVGKRRAERGYKTGVRSRAPLAKSRGTPCRWGASFAAGPPPAPAARRHSDRRTPQKAGNPPPAAVDSPWGGPRRPSFLNTSRHFSAAIILAVR
jgi:hypothetical protein